MKSDMCERERMKTMNYFNLRKCMSKRTRGPRLLIITGVFVVGYICSLATGVYTILNFSHPGDENVIDRGGGAMAEMGGPKEILYKLEDGLASLGEMSEEVYIGRRLMASNDSDDATYPKDLFSLDQRRHGAVILHLLGMIYMFIALAIVCDEFFVPSLGVITEKLSISEDVSGATFMAAGGSAPELFTSLIGVFIAKSDVGIGTIVGSAVFNILFVIGMCAIFSKEVLRLTWWPLFRDVSFYSVSLLLLIGFFSDDLIEWWEALLLFVCYIAYVTFMKFNHRAEIKLKNLLRRCRCSANKVNSSDQLLNEGAQQGRPTRSSSLPFLHSASGHYRHGMVQLMIHTIDPLSEATKVHDKAMQLQATLQVIVNPETERGSNNNVTSQYDRDNSMQIKVISNGKMQNGNSENNTSEDHGVDNSETGAFTFTSDRDHDLETGSKVTSRDVSMSVPGSPEKTVDAQSTVEKNKLEEEEEPLDMSWPDTARRRITYVLVAPIVFPLWFTLPDVRKAARRKYFPITFLGSIMWIAGFSYLMVWWANQTGETIDMPDEVMGLTILAAGTSIPDLITSVIVAKKGFGDMAVSSSVGSNIFDITVGLPIPWLLYSAINGGDSYEVNSKGLLCSIFLLFVMLIAVIVSIAVSSWKMSKVLGISMMGLYLVFVTLSVLLEFEIIRCPVT